MRLIFDIETDALLEDLTRVHCIVAQDEHGKVYRWGPEDVEAGLVFLAHADELIGHNILGFDLPAIRKVYPRFETKAVLRDTLVISRLVWPEIKSTDFGLAQRRPNFPKKLIGRYSLEAWGHRLGIHKGEKPKDFSVFTPETLDYCEQDVRVTAALWEKIQQHNVDPQAIELEQEFSQILDRQMRRGVGFDREAADRLLAQLQHRRAELDTLILQVCPPFKDEYVTPKKKLRKVRETEFNPQSRDHIARFFREKYGWKPSAFTPEGKPQIDEPVLAGMAFEEARLFEERLLLKMRLGQLADGKQNWLKCVKPDGRIYGYINHNGCVTGRCSHSGPNLGQVPRVGSPYGSECRALFIPGYGLLLVGGDASGLEVRCLAHYMARYDGGAYAKVVAEGDVHSENQAAAGLDTRDRAKTFLYALLYGAGDEKLGSIVGGGQAEGRKLRRRFLAKTPAFARLKSDIEVKVKKRRYLRSLDGRRLPVRSSHSALNTLLQGAGAVVMKQAVVFLHRALAEEGLTEAAQVLMVHDEVQLESHPDCAGRVGQLAVESIRKAGEHFSMRCPLDGAFKVGKTWAETH